MLARKERAIAFNLQDKMTNLGSLQPIPIAPLKHARVPAFYYSQLHESQR
nr:hypothetical protein [Nostoc sp. ChiSLP01]